MVTRTLSTAVFSLLLAGFAFGQTPPSQGLRAWYKPDGLTNGSLATWSDSSGNNLHLTQTNTSLQPVVVENTLNGWPVVDFRSTVKYLFTPNYNLTSEAEVFIVLSSEANSGGVFSLTGYALLYPSNNNIMDRLGATSSVTFGLGPVPASEHHIYHSRRASGLKETFQNGRMLHHSTPSSFTTVTSGRIGMVSSSSQRFQGHIAEILIYNRLLSDAERYEVEDYLAQKYNLAGTPVAPENVSATQLSKSQVIVSWVGDHDEKMNVRYDVYRRKSSLDPFVKVGESRVQASFIDTQIDLADVEYEYEVTASTIAGTSTASVSATVQLHSFMPETFRLDRTMLWISADSNAKAGKNTLLVDRSGYNRHFSQASLGPMPIASADPNHLNAHPTFNFNGTDSVYLTPNPGTVSQVEYFAILRATPNVAYQSRTLWNFGQYGMQYPYNSAGLIQDITFSSTTHRFSGPPSGLTSYNVFGGVSAPKYQYNSFNSLPHYFSADNDMWMPFSDPIQIGNRNGSRFMGDVAEIIFFDVRLSQFERQILHKYFIDKYGIDDSDGDGLYDSWEMHYFGTLAYGPDDDFDNDGLTNLQEFLADSDPTLADTDGDGVSDYDEFIIHRTDARLQDTDGDGVSDYDEILYGLDPNSPDGLLDHDRDGLLTWEEIYINNNTSFYMDPFVADTNGDGLLDSVNYRLSINPSASNPDGDGYNNATEALIGTSAILADSDSDGVDDHLDAFPRDPSRSAAPATNPSDTSPPVISITTPTQSVIVP